MKCLQMCQSIAIFAILSHKHSQSYSIFYKEEAKHK